MSKNKICYCPGCRAKATFTCPDCGRRVCELHTKGKYCCDCTREGDDIDPKSKEAKEMQKKLNLFIKKLEKKKQGI